MRHGQSINNVLGIESCRLETQTPYALTEVGREQVIQSAASAPKFDVIYSSPYRRAIETAQIMGDSQGIEVSIEFLLHEFRLPPELDQQPYEVTKAIIHNPENDLNHTPIGDSETFDAMHSRLTNLLLEIDAKHENQSILLVSHGSPIETFIQIMENRNTGFGPFLDLPKNAHLIHLNSLNLIAWISPKRLPK